LGRLVRTFHLLFPFHSQSKKDARIRPHPYIGQLTLWSSAICKKREMVSGQRRALFLLYSALENCFCFCLTTRCLLPPPFALLYTNTPTCLPTDTNYLIDVSTSSSLTDRCICVLYISCFSFKPAKNNDHPTQNVLPMQNT
jgi:hypothetical protein